MPKRGLEPPLPDGNYTLNVARLPIPPLRHMVLLVAFLQSGAYGGQNRACRNLSSCHSAPPLSSAPCGASGLTALGPWSAPPDFPRSGCASPAPRHPAAPARGRGHGPEAKAWARPAPSAPVAASVKPSTSAASRQGKPAADGEFGHAVHHRPREQGERPRISRRQKALRLARFDVAHQGSKSALARLLRLRIQVGPPGNLKHHGEMLGITERKLHVAAPARPKALQGAGRGFRRLGHRGRQAIKPLRRQRCQQFLLIAKMPVRRIVRNPCPPRHLAQSESAGARPCE